jgi:glycerate kinase
VEGFYGLSGDEQSAFIEMAAASGLELVAPSQRNPLKTTSWGTGELIRHALDAGVKHIIIGIGGSATNDGGRDGAGAGGEAAGRQGHALGRRRAGRLARIDLSEAGQRLAECRIEVACDVTNPLTGRMARQRCLARKRRHAEMIVTLDNALAHYARVIARDLDIDVLNLAGGGAAGAWRCTPFAARSCARALRL